MFAKTVPSLFAPYFEDFFVFSSDSYQMRALKLDILSTIATEVSVRAIFDEFQVPTSSFILSCCFLFYEQLYILSS